MKLLIVGNNDGPLYLLDSLNEQGMLDCVLATGLQKIPDEKLKAAYTSLLGPDRYFEDFEEDSLLRKINSGTWSEKGSESEKPDLLINCFCNFKFVRLLENFEVLNIHPSPLPAYRGRHPMHWALIRGEKRFGISIHRMTARYDEGPVVWQSMVEVPEKASVQQLRRLLMQSLAMEFPAFIYQYEQGSLQVQTQNEEQASYLRRRSPDDNILTEWDNSPLICRKVLALKDEPLPALLQKEPGGELIRLCDAEIVSSSYPKVSKPQFQFSGPHIYVHCCDGYYLQLRTCNGEENISLAKEHPVISNRN